MTFDLDESLAGRLKDGHRRETTTPTDHIADELQRVLGQRLVAYGAGVRTPKLIGRWAKGDQPNPDAEANLRRLYRTFVILTSEFGDGTARAWLTGSNPDLEDNAPIELLHQGERFVDVWNAAAAFVLPEPAVH